MLVKNTTQVGQTWMSWSIAFTVMLGAIVVAGPLMAQSDNSGQAKQQFTIPKFGNQTQAPVEQKPWTFEGRLHLQQDSTEGYLVLQMDIAEGHYIYSVSPEGSPAPTEISVVPSPSVQTGESFNPDQPPIVIENDEIFHRRLEKHTGRVQFFVPCRLDPHADYKLTGLPVIEFNGQVCSKDGVCIPIRNQRIPVEFAGYFEQQESAVPALTPESPDQANAIGIPENPTR